MLANIMLAKLERLAKNKHSNLFEPFVNYGKNSFIALAHSGTGKNTRDKHSSLFFGSSSDEEPKR